jgi:superoxide dismutase, Fe-Mn family
MSSHKNPLDSVDIDAIVKQSISQSMPKQSQVIETPEPDVVTESYVAEPKSYTQVSEMVSQKTKEAHHDLYKGYVEALNRTSAELDTVDTQGANPTHGEFKTLKADETHCLNAVWLHELYFANCFDPHSEIYMDSMAYLRIQRDYGTFDECQKDFVASGLASGEGWVVFGYNMFLKRYVNTIINDHSTNVMMGFYPVLVIDMFSHASFRDYLNDRKSYLVSQMREINWNTVEERMKKAESINEVLK